MSSFIPRFDRSLTMLPFQGVCAQAYAIVNSVNQGSEPF